MEKETSLVAAGHDSGKMESNHDSNGVPKTLHIYIQVEGEKTPRLVEISSNSRIKDVLAPLVEQGVSIGDDIVMFVEDDDDELPQDGALCDHGIGHRHRLHAHSCRKIEVRVSLNGTTHHHVFAPSARMAKVKKWAIQTFEKEGFESVDEMALEIVGTKEQPESDVHIGTLVKKSHCALAFNLVGKPFVQG